MDKIEHEVLKRLGRVTRNLTRLLRERGYIVSQILDQLYELSEDDFISFIYNQKIAAMSQKAGREIRARTLLTNTFLEDSSYLNMVNQLAQVEANITAIRNEYSQHQAAGFPDQLRAQHLQLAYSTESSLYSSTLSSIQSNTAVVIFLDTIKSADGKEVREMTDNFILSEIDTWLKSVGENPERTNYRHFILISELPYSANAKKIINEDKLASLRVELWTDEELGYVAIDHELTPQHRVIKKRTPEYKTMISKLNRKKIVEGPDGVKKAYAMLNLLPRLESDDRVVRFLGGEDGDLIEILVDNTHLPTLNPYGYTYAYVIRPN